MQWFILKLLHNDVVTSLIGRDDKYC